MTKAQNIGNVDLSIYAQALSRVICQLLHTFHRRRRKKRRVVDKSRESDVIIIDDNDANKGQNFHVKEEVEVCIIDDSTNDEKESSCSDAVEGADDTEEADSDNSDVVIEYYKEDKSTPIFRKGKCSAVYADYFKYLVDRPPMERVCTHLPALVEDNLSFIISVKPTDVPFSDMSCDGHSGWITNGVRTLTFCKSREGRYALNSKTKIPEEKMKANNFWLVKKYFKHRKYPDFRKSIVFIKNYRDQICSDLVYIQYSFTGSVHQIKANRHGNAKSDSIHSYCKIKPSVKEKAHKECTTKKSVAANVEDVGGIEKVKNPADLANPKSLYNSKRSTSSVRTSSNDYDDELSCIIDMAQNSLGHYVREVKQFPEPFVVLATDKQLQDLERFTCEENEHCQMSVDPTFKLGRFNVTPTTYRVLTLSTSASQTKFPIALGPLLIHYSKTEEVYTAFLQSLLRLRPGLSCLKAYGTDGETALCNALEKTFPQAISLRCFKHFEGNIKSKLSDLKLKSHEQNFLHDIIYSSNSLLNSKSIADFDKLFASLKSSWSEYDTSSKFTKYIESHVPVMKSSMIASVRTRAGLGLPPQRFYTNDSESNNFQIKQWIGFREKKLPVFVEEMNNFVKAQFADHKKAYCNIKGKYFVREEFVSQLKCDDYFRLTVSQRQAFLKKAESVSMSELLSFSLLPNAINSVNSGVVSISYGEAGINISKYTLKSIWAAAAQLILNAEKAISPAPCMAEKTLKFCVLKSLQCCEETQMVTFFTETGQLNCDCKHYSIHSVCSHSVACAEINDALKIFLKWHSDNKKTTNKYKQSTAALNLNCIGQKGNRPRRQRGPSKANTAFNNETVAGCDDISCHERMVILKHLHGTQIRKCYGCSQIIRNPPAVPRPPNDIVLAAKILYSFPHPRTAVITLKKDWKHFHLSRNCIKNYLDLGIHVCNLIKPKLTDIHWEYLKQELGIDKE